MLKVDRANRTFKRLDAPTLADARLLERADLQECIFNSSSDFFTEIGEDVFVIGKEVSPSDTVSDRIDILAIDRDGAAVIVELKRGSDKLQMLQAISYAGMVARWGPDDFRGQIAASEWEALVDFLDVDVEEINRRQRLLLVAEEYDYALLSGAEWLSEHFGVDIRCSSITLATDIATGAEYLACTSIFPPPALAEQAAARSRSPRGARPPKWSSWEEALAAVENRALRAFAENELAAGREHNITRRGLHFRLGGKRRWSLYCREAHAYVWQRGRFPNDVDFWRSYLSAPESVEPKKRGAALRFNLATESDFAAFKEAMAAVPENSSWFDAVESESAPLDGDDVR